MTNTMTIQQITTDVLQLSLSQTDFKTVRRHIRKSFEQRTARTVNERSDDTAHVYRDRHVYVIDSDDYNVVKSIIERVASSSPSLRTAAIADAVRHAKRVVKTAVKHAS